MLFVGSSSSPPSPIFFLPSSSLSFISVFSSSPSSPFFFLPSSLLFSFLHLPILRLVLFFPPCYYSSCFSFSLPFFLLPSLLLLSSSCSSFLLSFLPSASISLFFLSSVPSS